VSSYINIIPNVQDQEKNNDDRMIDDYFKHLNNYQTKFGEKTLLLWQCESFMKFILC
jgi:hypothetical protein